MMFRSCKLIQDAVPDAFESAKGKPGGMLDTTRNSKAATICAWIEPAAGTNRCSRNPRR